MLALILLVDNFRHTNKEFNTVSCNFCYRSILLQVKFNLKLQSKNDRLSRFEETNPGVTFHWTSTIGHIDQTMSIKFK